MPIPDSSFSVSRQGRQARLRLRGLPVPNTFFFANNVSVAGEVDVTLTWRATSDPISRGEGGEASADSPNAYAGELRDATCRGRAAGRHIGFSAQAKDLSEEGYVAQLGYTRNGVFLD